MHPDEESEQVSPALTDSVYPMPHPHSLEESRETKELIRVFLAGPRLLCSSLANTIRSAANPTFSTVCLGDEECSIQSKHDQVRFCISNVTVFVLICCSRDDLQSLLTSSSVSSLLAINQKKEEPISIVLVSPSIDLALVIPSFYRERVHAHVPLDASEAELREAVAAALKISTTTSNDRGREQNFDLSSSAQILRKGGSTSSLCPLPVPKRISGLLTSTTESLKLRYQYRYLTAREAQTAQLAAKGLSNREIAEHLCTTVATVKSHLQSAFKKTDVKRRSQLFTLFTASKMLPPDNGSDEA